MAVRSHEVHGKAVIERGDLSLRDGPWAEPSLARVSSILRFERMISRFLSGATLAGAAGAGACLLASPGHAQGTPVISRPVVQALPSNDTKTLGDALTRLGRNPRDIEALIDAGDAARALGDFDAAIGFYRRADEISANNPRIKAGMASALVFSGDPVAAIPVFAEAERAGARPQAIASDRGLAYDLVGDNAAAQRYYSTALGGADDDELRMRLAVSQAIGGDAAAAEATLMPLLRKQDKPAWRTRAFTLGIAGKTKAAVELANTILPEKLAQSMAPYLRYMPRLTKAQQAAAANLGKFPRASEIGRDEPRIAAYRPAAQIASAGAALVPKGPQLGGSAAKADRKADARSRADAEQAAAAQREAEAAESRRKAALASVQADRVAPPEPKPAIERNGVELPPLDANGELPPAGAPAGPGSLARPNPAPAQIATPPVRTMPAAPAPAVSPGFDLARVGTEAPAAPPARETPPEPGPAQLSLSEIFADLGKPTTRAAPAPGAVDISRIQPARPKPPEEVKPVEKPKKPAPPTHPSRIWVQIGVGRDKDAIAFDWRRYTRQAPELFKGREAHVSEMGRTNRILAGPFASNKAANDFIADLRKEGIEGALPWTSPAGQVVDALPAK
jgi:Flp pilus assembly protein TadD